jgi:hypothetical protein
VRAFVVALLLVLVSPSARADRWAILVGNNAGHGVDVPLRFAETDAARVSQTLTELGGFDRSHVRLLDSPDADAVERTFDEVSRAIAAAKDERALVVFYYSGHADGATLHLGDSSLDLYRVRDLLAHTGGSVRIGILDACGAGAIIGRRKGLEAAPPFMVTTPPELSQQGQVLIAAVSATEAAQESDVLRGSFFTNYFVAGLRGAADRTGSGRVTLDDAYRYSTRRTASISPAKATSCSPSRARDARASCFKPTAAAPSPYLRRPTSSWPRSRSRLRRKCCSRFRPASTSSASARPAACASPACGSPMGKKSSSPSKRCRRATSCGSRAKGSSLACAFPSATWETSSIEAMAMASEGSQSRSPKAACC